MRLVRIFLRLTWSDLSHATSTLELIGRTTVYSRNLAAAFSPLE